MRTLIVLIGDMYNLQVDVFIILAKWDVFVKIFPREFSKHNPALDPYSFFHWLKGAILHITFIA